LESLTLIPHFYASSNELNNSENTKLYGLTFFLATFIFHTSLYIFLINLIIHILIRSLWIGAIGLRYVSGDIDYKNLNYSSKFTNYYQRKIGSFDKYIQQLENFASILFSFTFLLFFILLSLYLYILWPLLFSYFAKELIPALPKIYRLTPIYLFFVLGLIVAFDFISLGMLKKVKNKYFSAIYLSIYRFFSKITFSFLWRPMLLNFLDQSYTRRLFLMIIPYLVFLSAIFGFDFINYGYYPTFYDGDKFSQIINSESYYFLFYEEERNKYPITDTYERQIKHFSIPSKKISGYISEIFVKAQNGDKWLIEKIDSTITPFEEEGLSHEFITGFIAGANSRQKQDSLKVNLNFQQNLQKSKSILEKAILLKIDNKPIPQEAIDCDYYYHPHEKAKGLLCFFPIDSLQLGRHHLTVGKVVGKKNEKDKDIYLDTTFHTIPFIYEGYR